MRIAIQGWPWKKCKILLEKERKQRGLEASMRPNFKSLYYPKNKN
jgi:hypothetical protein